MEIGKKLKRSYPRDNIVFEYSHSAVLDQNGGEVPRCDLTEKAALERLPKLFFARVRPEIVQFRAYSEPGTASPTLLRQAIDGSWVFLNQGHSSV